MSNFGLPELVTVADVARFCLCASLLVAYVVLVPHVHKKFTVLTNVHIWGVTLSQTELLKLRCVYLHVTVLRKAQNSQS